MLVTRKVLKKLLIRSVKLINKKQKYKDASSVRKYHNVN